MATIKVDRGPLPLTPVQTAWGLSLNSQLTLPPVYDATRAFFSIEGDRLAAYDLISGKQLWMITAQPQMEPAAGDNLVFLLESGTLKALHATDGTVAWEMPFADKPAAHPVWDNGWLILAAANGEITALRASDGHVIWHRDLKSPAHAAPALAADRVYVPTADNRIVALRVETGEPLWDRHMGGTVNEILALTERIFVGSQDSFFSCVLASNGKVDWRIRIGGDLVGKPIADEHYVYFAAADNLLRAMNQVSGGQQWIRSLPMRPVWGPIKAGSTIVVAGLSPTLRAFNVKDGVASGTLTGVSVPPPETPAAPAADAPADAAPKAPAPVVLGGLAPDAEVAVGPHVLEDPVTHLPLVLMLFREISKGGASATLVTHSLEPTLIPAVAALPNLVQIAPVAPTTPPPRP